MQDTKRLKDPIYGYIEIPRSTMNTVVDTAEFQRLRNIIQTSYAPLYSSAVHNRFVHSLGVYHLGRIVTSTIRENISSSVPVENLERTLQIFELACLLHDLGHSPFSHTGEEYYLNNGSRNELHREVIELTGDRELEEEIKNKNYKAAPHELMSVIVSLKRFREIFRTSEEKSLFARCILGYLYGEKNDLKHSFLNCIISFLNSSIIDVDRLDYLIRDAYLTGFDTISIDYERLLKSVNIVLCKDKYEVVYAKSAISVIENVVYAHDAERKWIQNHPVVQYEAYLLRNVIDSLAAKYCNNKLFSYESLTVQGTKLSNDYRISLLSDADIIFLMKNMQNDSVDEYFQRQLRRHPLWKSEPEYKALFKKGFTDEMFDKFDVAMDELSNQMNFVCRSQEINQTALDLLIKDLKATKRMAEKADIDSINKNRLDMLVKKKEKNVKWLEVFNQLAEKQGIPFDFVIIKANQFNSGFAKEAFGNILISFDSIEEPQKFKDVTSVLKADKSSRDKFFYLYYRKNEDNHKIDLKAIANTIAQAAVAEVYS